MLANCDLSAKFPPVRAISLLFLPQKSHEWSGRGKMQEEISREERAYRPFREAFLFFKFVIENIRVVDSSGFLKDTIKSCVDLTEQTGAE